MNTLQKISNQFYLKKITCRVGVMDLWLVPQIFTPMVL